MNRLHLSTLICLSLTGTVSAAENPVTLAQVTAAPANRQLSYTFAVQQVRAGRLDQAAVALKQVLHVAPDWDAARLFYGIVLFRLNDLAEARTELAAVARRPLTEAQQEEVARYVALIEARTGEVHEAAFLPPSPAQSGIAGLLDLNGGEARSPSPGLARIDGAFASAEIARQNEALGGHGSFLFLGEAGDPADTDTEADFDRSLTNAARQPVLSLGKVRVTADVLRTAFGDGALQGVSWHDAGSALEKPSPTIQPTRFLATSSSSLILNADAPIPAASVPVARAWFPKPVARPANPPLAVGGTAAQAF